MSAIGSLFGMGGGAASSQELTAAVKQIEKDISAAVKEIEKHIDDSKDDISSI